MHIPNRTVIASAEHQLSFAPMTLHDAAHLAAVTQLPIELQLQPHIE